MLQLPHIVENTNLSILAFITTFFQHQLYYLHFSSFVINTFNKSKYIMRNFGKGKIEVHNWKFL